ncbi:hypothetical protein GCM10027613_18410 [Microlunatus endophyticus]
MLDVGCGSGATILSHADRLGSAVGIDTDADHVRLARRALSASGHTNVRFEQLGFEQATGPDWDDRFDLVICERGPIGYSAESVRVAIRLLKPEGALLVEMIGDLHHQEVAAAWGTRRRQPVNALDTVTVAFDRCDLDIRVAANLITRRFYPDVYEWLKFQCSIWAWSGRPLPEPDDPGLQRFVDRSADNTGRVVTTHHVVVVGGVKRCSK